jgi:predicted nuclease with TOPRIM domain
MQYQSLLQTQQDKILMLKEYIHLNQGEMMELEKRLEALNGETEQLKEENDRLAQSNNRKNIQIQEMQRNQRDLNESVQASEAITPLKGLSVIDPHHEGIKIQSIAESSHLSDIHEPNDLDSKHPCLLRTPMPVWTITSPATSHSQSATI